MRRVLRPAGFTSRILEPKGTVLLEVLVSSLVLLVLILAVATFFVGNLTAFGRGKEQMEVQRMGTLAMEAMTRTIREGSRAIGNTIGASGAYQDIQIFYDGEPFFDANHNGVCDPGEDFADIYERDPDGSTVGFQGVWNCASDGTGANPMPTVYFGLDLSGPGGGVIKKGTQDSDSVPWDTLVNDATAGSIWVDDLGFDIDSGARFVRVTLRIRNDMATNDQTDDITMDFVSSVDLRE